MTETSRGVVKPATSRPRHLKVYVLVLTISGSFRIEGVYASLEAADKAETAWNRKNPFNPWTPSIQGQFALRGTKAAAK